MSTSVPAFALIGAVQLYKWTLSPYLGRECRYQPTCSSYAIDALARHGAWKGAWMATARLCRCAPWGGFGYDPAPVEAPAPWYAPWRAAVWRCEVLPHNPHDRSAKS